jgi:hypothetical protein
MSSELQISDILIPSDETINAILSSEAPTEQPEEQPNVVTTASGIVISDASELVDKTVFLKVGFGILGNSRKVSGSEVLTTDADLDRIKVSKTLLDAPELEAIKKADTKMRTYLYNTCLPFDMGIMLLPWGLVETVDTRLKEYAKEREALVDEFLKVYPTLVNNAKAHLGSLYNEMDYPNVAVARSKFAFTYRLLSLSVPGKLKSISAAMFKAETEKAAAQIQNALEDITLIMRQELLDMVTNLEDRLSPGDEGKPKKFKETTVTNLQSFLDGFDIRNVANDQELAKLVAKAKEIVGGTSAPTLRSSDEFREKVRAGMASIKDQLAGLVVEKGRKFRLDED